MFVSILLAMATAVAERLPVRRYTTENGLPGDRVEHVFRDSRGFLWFATSGGLARFDGQRFRVYGPSEGLIHESVEQVVEDREGRLWFATWGGGIYRLDPERGGPGRSFARFSLSGAGASDRVHSLALGRGDRLWVGTLTGLYSLDPTDPDRGFEPVPLFVNGAEVRPRIWQLVEDRRQTLWLATPLGLLCRAPDGTVLLQPVVPDRAVHVNHVFEDRDGRIWVGHHEGISAFAPGQAEGSAFRFAQPGFVVPETAAAPPDTPGQATWFAPFGGPGPGRTLGQTSDGDIWLAQAGRGFVVFSADGIHRFAANSGLGLDAITLAEDSAGNLWFGKLDAGTLRLAATGLTAFDRHDGLSVEAHVALAAGRDGRAIVVSERDLHLFDGDRFTRVRPLLPDTATIRAVMSDRDGRIWIGTSEGLFRAARATDPMELPVPRRPVTALYEGSGGEIWVGVNRPPGLLRLEGPGGGLRAFGPQDGLPSAGPPRSLAEDRSGQVWIVAGGGLFRYRGGRFSPIVPTGSPADCAMRNLAVDSRGRLWVTASPGGLFRANDPGAENPALVPVASPTGDLAAIAVGEDAAIYLGTQAGILRLDPEGGEFSRFTTADGLAGNEVDQVIATPGGALWFASRGGVSRFVPGAASGASTAPPVRIEAIRIAGEALAVPDAGVLEFAGPVLGPRRNFVIIDFAGIHFAAGGPLRYQSRLEGAASDWSDPLPERSVSLVNLAPGRYRFEVRAVDPSGRVSPRPASFSFRILPPFYRRWWFLLLSALTVSLAAYGVHRYRIRHLLALERVRTRIATDLHDDIGSSLSQISILSEVARQRIPPGDGSLDGVLAKIAGVSREMVDSMSDIVWAINPKRDSLDDLVFRMRRFASDALTAREIEFTFVAPTGDRSLPLGPDLRRELYLIFKESINNAVKHSGCGRVEVEMHESDSRLTLTIRDDGRGFEPGREVDGNGLASMARRAERVGGLFRVDSAAGQGTTVRLETPISGRRRRR